MYLLSVLVTLYYSCVLGDHSFILLQYLKYLIVWFGKILHGAKTTEANAEGYFTVALFQCIDLLIMGQYSAEKIQRENLPE